MELAAGDWFTAQKDTEMVSGEVERGMTILYIRQEDEGFRRHAASPLGERLVVRVSDSRHHL